MNTTKTSASMTMRLLGERELANGMLAIHKREDGMHVIVETFENGDKHQFGIAYFCGMDAIKQANKILTEEEEASGIPHGRFTDKIFQVNTPKTENPDEYRLGDKFTATDPQTGEQFTWKIVEMSDDGGVKLESNVAVMYVNREWIYETPMLRKNS